MKKIITLGTIICIFMHTNNAYGMLPIAKRIIKSPNTRIISRKYCSHQKSVNIEQLQNATVQFNKELNFLLDYNKQMIANLTKQSLVIEAIQKNVAQNNGNHPFSYMLPHAAQLEQLANEQRKIETKATYFFSKEIHNFSGEITSKE